MSPLLCALAAICVAFSAMPCGATIPRAPEATQGLPPPLVPFQTNPNPADKDNIIPTATPLVLSSVSAFVCYTEISRSIAYCQMVDPATGGYNFPNTSLVTSNSAAFDNPPLQLGPVSALYSTSWSDASYWGASSNMLATPAQTRYNSTAMPATDPNTFSAFVPFGVHQGDDFLMGYDTLVLNNISWLYNINPWTGRGRTYPNGLSLLHDVIYYRGLLLFMHNNTFYNYNATTGSMLFSVPNPCNVNVQASSMNLARGTFGSDANGDLDAFIVYGNTSTQSAKEFVVCRVSHLTGALEWKYTMADDFVVDDLVGGSGLLLLSGSSVIPSGVAQFSTIILDASANRSYGFIPRSTQDAESYPIFVPSSAMPAHCGPAIVLQQHTNLTAFCVNPIYINRTVREAQWSAKYECNYRAVYDPTTTQLVCTSVGSTVVSLMAGTGMPVWIDSTRTPASQPVLMIELGVSYAFVLDGDATLWGYQIPLVAPTPQPLPPSPPTPAPVNQGTPGGLSGGAAAGIAVGVILVAAAAGFGVLQYFRRSRRRQSYQTSTNLNQEYGSLS